MLRYSLADAIAWWAQYYFDDAEDIGLGILKNEPGALSVSDYSKLTEIPPEVLVQYLEQVRTALLFERLDRHQVVLALANYISPLIARGEIGPAEGAKRMSLLCTLDDLGGQLVPFRELYDTWCTFPKRRTQTNSRIVNLAKQCYSLQDKHKGT